MTQQHNKTGKVRRVLFFFLFVFFLSIRFSLISAQSPKVDSLLNVLKTAQEDTVKLKLRYEIGEETMIFRMTFWDSLLIDAVKFKMKKYEAEVLSNIGYIYQMQGEMNEALDNFRNSLKIREEIGDKRGIGNSLNNIGYVYKNQGQIKEALINYGRCLKLQEEIGDMQGIANALNNIGVIYKGQGQSKEAFEYYERSFKIWEEIGDKKGMAYSLGNISDIYRNQRQFEEALAYLERSLKIREEIGDKQGMANSLNNIGTIYKDNNQFKESLINYERSLKISEEINDKREIARSLNNISSTLFKQNKIKQAKEYAMRSLSIAKKSGYAENIYNVEELLSKIDSAGRNFADAFEHYKQYIIYRDSISNQETRKASIKKQMQYEFEKKEAATKVEQDKKDIITAEEKKKQQIIIWSVVGGLFLVALVLLIVFRSLKITRKQKYIIEIQKDEVTRQKDIVEEQKEEIAHKNKDLTDSINYAQRIQQAILTSEQYLNDMFLPQGQTASHFVLYKPKDIVAGDFYWAYKTPDGKAIWVAADSTGHGVPGAFMSMIGNSLLNEIVVEKGIHEPDEILNRLRAGVIKSLGQGVGADDKRKDGMDAALCCWDRANNKISFSGANNSLWIFRKWEFIEIPPDSQPVGQHLVMNPFTKREFQLQNGDTLYTFTDGYCDQFGGLKGKKFKYKPFRELLISIQDKSMSEQKEILNKTIDDWRGTLEQIDDICVFGVRV